MKVRDVMNTKVLKIDEQITVDNAIKIMQDNSLSSLIIEPQNNKDSYGIITELDILYKVIAKGHNPEQLSVREIMTKPCIEVKPELSIQAVAQLFTKTGICHAPIVQKKLFGPRKLIGIISVKDLIPQSNFVEHIQAKELNQTNQENLNVVSNSNQQKSAPRSKDQLTDYQRLRSQGAISAYSTRILDKMSPQHLKPDSSPQESSTHKESQIEGSTNEATKNKSSQKSKDNLTDYQRLRSQGAISRYSTRILDKMPADEPFHSNDNLGEQSYSQPDEITKKTTDDKQKKSAKKNKNNLTDYQRLRSQGAISRYSTRILDKMPEKPKDE